MSILNKTVSYFPSITATSRSSDASLLSILESAKHRQVISRLRATTDEAEQAKIKSLLPCYTVAGTFSERKESGLIQLSGLAAIDLDGAEGCDLPYLLRELRKLQYIAYAGLSCRGRRLFAIIPLLHTELYRSHYNRLIKSFEDMGLPMGDTCHKQISQPRFVSSNTPETCFFNHNAWAYTFLEPERIISFPKKMVSNKYSENQLFSFSSCLENHNTRHNFINGNRHSYILHLVGFCKKVGVNEREVLAGCLRFNQPDFDETEITNIVKYFYSGQASKQKLTSVTRLHEDAPSLITELTPSAQYNETSASGSSKKAEGNDERNFNNKVTVEDKGELLQLSKLIKVIDVPLSQINVDVAAFQNRDEDYCRESVDRFKQAVYSDTFNWNEFDPILLWQNPNDNNLYVLAGHSRNKAFNELTDEGWEGFEAIPAKIIKGITKAEAQKKAKNSNCLGTKETNTARAKYYREMREGGSKKYEILTEAKLHEGRNANRLIALSYLNPDGKTMIALKAFEESCNVDSTENISKIAKWIGEARKAFRILTDSHENELCNWLANMEIFKNILTEKVFLARVGNLTRRLSFDVNEPLNLFNRATKTYYDNEYEQQLADKNQEIANQQKIINDNTVLYNNERKSPKQIVELLNSDYIIKHKLQQDLVSIEENNGIVKTANKGILGLFDNVNDESMKDGIIIKVPEILAEFCL